MTSGTIEGETGFALQFMAGASWNVSASPLDIADRFFDEEFRLAQKLSQGEVEAGRSLADEWTVRAAVDLALPMRGIDDAEWRVLRTPRALIDLIAATKWWELGPFVRGPGRFHAYLVLATSSEWIASSRFAVMTAGAIAGPSIPSPTPADVAALRRASGQMDRSALTPDELRTAGVVGEVLSDLNDGLAAAAAAWAWFWMSTACTVTTSAAELEFFGQRRIAVELPGSGIPAEDVLPTLELFEWLAIDPSPDRFAALRQVAAFKDPETLVSSAGELRRAAEPIYVALRGSTVAEVVRSQREARQAVVAAGRQASEAVVSASKAIAERSLAALLALGGLVLTKASTNVSDADLERLAFGVASAACALLFWHMLIEGPAMTLPLRTIRSDLGVIGDLLTAEERSRALNMAAMHVSQWQATKVRIGAIAMYSITVALSLTFAHPHPTWFWHWVRNLLTFLATNLPELAALALLLVVIGLLSRTVRKRFSTADRGDVA